MSCLSEGRSSTPSSTTPPRSARAAFSARLAAEVRGKWPALPDWLLRSSNGSAVGGEIGGCTRGAGDLVGWELEGFEAQIGVLEELRQAMHARDIASLLSAVSRVEAQQCETAELAEARQEALWKSLHDAIVEVEAAGSADFELSTAQQLLSDERLKESGQTALLLALRVADIDAWKAAMQLGEAAGLVDSELVWWAQAFHAKTALDQLELKEAALAKPASAVVATSSRGDLPPAVAPTAPSTTAVGFVVDVSACERRAQERRAVKQQRLEARKVVSRAKTHKRLGVN